MKLPDWWDDFCLVLFVALLLTISIFIAKATAVVPPVFVPADHSPLVYPDQLHPVDVVEMAGPLSPDVDPCPFETSPEGRAQCWVRHAFAPEDWHSALEVARWESGHDFSVTVVNPLHCAPASVGHAHATGLFQHCDIYWTERTTAAYPDHELDILNGWHSTLMAAYVVYEMRGGWIHFHSCASSARWWRENRGVGGGGWVKTC